MRFHSLWKVLMAGVGCGLVAAACSAPDPGAYTLSDKTPRVGGATTSGSSGTTGSTSGGSTSGATSSGSTGTSGGSTSSSGDAGHDSGSSGAPVPDGFKGAPAYVATNGQAATSASHNTANNLPPSHDCLSCHTPGGAAAAKEFIIGGYAKGTAGNGKIEVRVVNSAGTEVAQAYTESNGYFYVLGTNLTGNGNKVAVRTTTATGMVGAITSGGCDSAACHGGGQGDIHNP
jgi:hypothetical protein